MESLAALKPEQPIESQRQMDSMEGLFLRHGLNVQIITQAGKNLDYSIAPWQDALLVFTEPSRPGKYYTCSLPGYRAEVLLNIALSAPLWQRQHLGVARPNEIKAVNVAWCNPWEEFTVVVDSVSGHAKVYDDRKSAPIHYDTLRLSTFLYSLTQLEYQPATAEQSAQYAQSLQEGRGKLFRLTILRQSMDTLIYSIYATQEESDKDSTDPDRAIIRLSEGQYGTIQLSKWALTMVHVDALREREALR